MTSEQRRRNCIAGIILLLFAAGIFVWTIMQGGGFIVNFSSN